MIPPAPYDLCPLRAHDRLRRRDGCLRDLPTSLSMRPTLWEHVVGMLADWLRDLRLAEGQKHLKSGHFSTVGEVAAEVGRARPYFSRLYRAQLGRPPGEDLEKAP
jgi:AraC-like DNA-binding protein